MKKLLLMFTVLLCLISISGCSKKQVNLNPGTISTNTFLAKSDGKLQVATVENFDKAYYKLNELEEFVKKNVSDYNKTVGGEKVTIDDIRLQDGKAVMLLSYTGMDQYSNFNHVMAAYFNGGTKDVKLDLPDTLVNAKSGSLSSTAEVLQDSKYKVLVLSESYEIIVDGKIKYYSGNAILSNNNEIKSAADGVTVVVFKP